MTKFSRPFTLHISRYGKVKLDEKDALAIPPEERIEMCWTLSKIEWMLKGKPVPDRMRRDVVRVIRRRPRKSC